MYAADQPCTSPTVHSDTAVVGPAFAHRKCILCCIDSDENLQALTSVGIQSLIDNCNLTGMTHRLYQSILRSIQMWDIRHAGSKLLIKLAEHAKLKLPVETRQKCRLRVWLVHFLSRTCVFCGESVTGYDKADIRRVWIGREFDDSLREAVKKA